MTVGLSCFNNLLTQQCLTYQQHNQQSTPIPFLEYVIWFSFNWQNKKVIIYDIHHQFQHVPGKFSYLIHFASFPTKHFLGTFQSFCTAYIYEYLNLLSKSVLNSIRNKHYKKWIQIWKINYKTFSKTIQNCNKTLTN